MNAQHSSKSNEHYTPPEYIEAAREVMGGIDLDPATSFAANQTVRAKHWWQKEDDGLGRTWHGRVWLNPPGGVTKSRQSNALLWWRKLLFEWNAGHVEQAVFLGFSIEILQSSQSTSPSVGDFHFCVPRKRIRFLDESGRPGKSPTHANVLAYLPSLRTSQDVYQRRCARFCEVFSQFGFVK